MWDIAAITSLLRNMSSAANPRALLGLFLTHAAGSLPLGILDDSSSYVEDTIHLQPGDLLLFYSDGITEARAPS